MSETTDTGALPMTEPHWPPSFDTGPHPTPLPGSEAIDEPCTADEPVLAPEPDSDDSKSRSSTAKHAKPPKPIVVSGQYRFLKWWHLALVLAGVWIPAVGIGLGLFTWWYSSADKTPAVFAVLVYATVCVVAGLIVAMVGEKPVLSAVAIALMSAVFASAVAAAPLYGHYFCQHVDRCIGGIIPY
ncbi:hypothetical protein [Mycolicibacter longobardus]|uniref:Transmembrane protein n=1 Tax=Mycolicibacter longobardus TaxID=1108812 RepID=A0A1X1YIH0_9MYCO|nr:hypothetical protein [Mycolicibacter longobardus]MCV7384915.1 hypothetical protein [Mycolicibacter longobardus]ORW10919.1 hypothetical protein AWC16_12670 [Mycolicibacter longobardus]